MCVIGILPIIVCVPWLVTIISVNINPYGLREQNELALFVLSLPTHPCLYELVSSFVLEIVRQREYT